jgi:hypothetical protein
MTYWSKQITGLFIALVALVVIATSDYRRVIDAAPIFYGLGLLLRPDNPRRLILAAIDNMPCPQV